MDKIETNFSLTDDEKIRLVEMMEETSSVDTDSSDGMYNCLIDESEYLNENVFDDDGNGHDGDDRINSSYYGINEAEENKNDNCLKESCNNIDSDGPERDVLQLSHSDEDDAYNIDPELQQRLDDIDFKLESLNSSHTIAMQEITKFQEDDFNLKKRLRDIDEDLKKLSSKTTLCAKHRKKNAIENLLNQLNSDDEEDDDDDCTCEVEENKEDNVCEECCTLDNGSIKTLEMEDDDDDEENSDWLRVKKRYNSQVEKIEEMLAHLSAMNDRDLALAAEEERIEALERTKAICGTNN